MTTRTSALRHTLAMFTTALVTVALAVCAALVLMTTWLQQSSALLADSMDSVRLAQDVQIDLLVHERTEDPDRRARLERELLRRLEEMRTRVAGSGSARLAEAEKALAVYVSAANGGHLSLRDSERLRTRLSTSSFGRASCNPSALVRTLLAGTDLPMSSD